MKCFFSLVFMFTLFACSESNNEKFNVTLRPINLLHKGHEHIFDKYDEVSFYTNEDSVTTIINVDDIKIGIKINAYSYLVEDTLKYIYETYLYNSVNNKWINYDSLGLSAGASSLNFDYGHSIERTLYENGKKNGHYKFEYKINRPK